MITDNLFRFNIYMKIKEISEECNISSIFISLRLYLRRGTLYPDELRGHYRKKGGMIAVEGLWLKVR